MSADYNDDYLMHYGVSKLDGAPGRGSGRYPLGSGDDPYQHSGDFLSRVDELRKAGVTFYDEKTGKTYTGDTAVAKTLGLTTSQFRTRVALAKDERRKADVAYIKKLTEEGKSRAEISRIMGINESSIRSLMKEKSTNRMNEAQNIADILKKQVDEKGMIEIGAGVEQYITLDHKIGVSREKFQQALDILEVEGYPTYRGRINQVTNAGRKTTITVLCPPGTEHKEIFDPDEIHAAMDYKSEDGGATFKPSFVYPASMDSKRLKIRYAEEGGREKDGLIEIRRGVEDLDLGGHYAQVRILVDGDRYLKGMAVYSDDMPDGVDVVFNTNKHLGTDMRKVLKEIKYKDKESTEPAENPFGSLIKDFNEDDPMKGGQHYYIGKDGKEHLSLINKRGMEGDWEDWSKKLPSQFLSKQPLKLVDQQLALTAAEKYEEYAEICALTNPTIKRKLLETFAEDCDSAAVHLKAAALPRQKYQVILPLTTIKDNEVYAPNFEDGETVALVRFPHAGTFEIPILKVNNKNAEGRKMISTNPKDAVGINAKVADQLSGADFDGDTVLVIPCNSPRSKVRITAREKFDALAEFDPKEEYGGKPEGTYQRMTKGGTQTEMGKISNLITDMTLKGAGDDELIKAVKHSMVVIDAEKHGLDYKQSEKDNDIAALKRKWQGHYTDEGTYSTGASTLISRASAEQQVLKRVGSPKIDPKTGKLSYNETLETYTDKKGKTQVRTQKSTQMAEVDDAYKLSSGTPIEDSYANYANQMKALANSARKEMKATPLLKYDAEARARYQAESDSLTAKLNNSKKNAPRERMAQIMANSVVNAKKNDNPDMSKAEIKKASQMALTKARQQMGAQRTLIDISDREWAAIQAGAISDNKLMEILRYADTDRVRQLATPRNTKGLTDTQISMIKSMSNAGYTNQQIAERLNISTSTVSKNL